ncbi:MAG: type I-E CRISPR-associated protein Cas5/CasD [Desulfomonile tiedjei]|uniref:Type I-E CRISPR-associated protein Cas5/CasD n=1 Tax=Desulfomonile tiedjei TaxID=2358 RepID=A0A9D6UX77_9BACT|nr:type I-E CRISPR-associated protein Cas5/CasD [Desulfomonile tiedjei]
MGDTPNTVFLRLEGPLQAWGDNSKFVIRRTMEAPTKSGVMGLISCARGLTRQAASKRLPELNALAMGVRIDRAGTRWWDYHTVGAGYGVLTAAGKIKKTASTGKYETLITRREYLCDANFLVALQGYPGLIEEIAEALQKPEWPVFLGRKCCSPSVPILVTRMRSDGNSEADTGPFDSLEEALASQAWRPRYDGDTPHNEARNRSKTIQLDCLIEWRPTPEIDIAPADAEVWYDAPVSLDPPVHEPRLVKRTSVQVSVGKPLQLRTPPPTPPRADYSNKEFRKRRKDRLKSDQGLCVFCKSPATTVQHVTYRRAGGHEDSEDLRSLCRLCHDAITMIEYGLGMGLDRINPEDPLWRDDIIAKRDEIRRWRSEEGRRRALRGVPVRVRRELLEEGD